MRWLAILLLIFSCAQALAHEDHSALELTINETSVQGEWNLRLADLDANLTIKLDERAAVENALRSALNIRGDDADLFMQFTEIAFGDRRGIPYVRARWRATAVRTISTLEIDYGALSNTDPAGHADIRVAWADAGIESATASADHTTLKFIRSTSTSHLSHFFGQGLKHFLTGLDHLVFLFILLLPCVLRRSGRDLEPVPTPSHAVRNTLLTVLSFSTAAATALTASIGGVITAPIGVVEPAIAASILFVAILNLFADVSGVFARLVLPTLGALHGLGFVNLFDEHHQSADVDYAALLGVTTGIALAALLVAGSVVTLLFKLRHHTIYRKGLLGGGSIIAMICASAWLWMRLGLS